MLVCLFVVVFCHVDCRWGNKLANEEFTLLGPLGTHVLTDGIKNQRTAINLVSFSLQRKKRSPHRYPSLVSLI